MPAAPAAAAARRRRRCAARSARLGRRDRGDVGQLERIAGRDQQSLFAPREADHHGVVQAGRRRPPRRYWRASSSPSMPVQMDGGGRSPRRAPAGASRLRCPPADSRDPSRFRATPIRAADRGCRRRSAAPVARELPAAISPAATQRSSAAFGNSQRPVTLLQGTAPVGDQLIELALAQPQIGGGLVGGEQFRHEHACRFMQYAPEIDRFRGRNARNSEGSQCRTDASAHRPRACGPIRRCSRSSGCR